VNTLRSAAKSRGWPSSWNCSGSLDLALEVPDGRRSGEGEMSLLGMFREPRLQSPAYLAAVRKIDTCTIRKGGVCVGVRDGIMACHSNEELLGKGKGLKSHDIFTVAGCPPCHAYVDEERHEDRFELMRNAHFRTFYILFRDEVLKVRPR
jgi:hypothetical protein